jgi:DNA-binding MarR family transcriptional regulator
MATKTLRDELKKRRAFDSVEQEAMLSVLRTSDLLENRLARLLRAHDLTPSQYNSLRILRGEATPMPCLEIAARMIQVVPAITRVVDQLLARDLINKTQSEEDRRVFLVQLTASGKTLLRRLDPPILKLHQSLLGNVDTDDLRELIRTLATIRQQIHARGRE